MKIELPDNYRFRYTLDYLVQIYSIQNDKEIREIELELSELMNIKTRMVRYYRKELIDSTRRLLSDETLGALGEYFGVSAKQLITEQVLLMSIRA